MERCKNCEFDYCAVESKYGDMDCYAYIVDEKTKPYKQTLKEIKEFAEHFCSKHCPNCDDEECEMCIEDCILDEIVNPILQKISEIENQ